MSREIKFKQTGGPYGDQCCGYDVKGCEGMNLKEFVDYILEKNPKEWGYFETPNHTFEYRYGELLNKALSGILSQMEITKVTANGGWTRMDYKIQAVFVDELDKIAYQGFQNGELSLTDYLRYLDRDKLKVTKKDKAMSRETIFKDGASVGGYEYTSATRLTEDIAKKEADISYYKERLLALVMATPKDIALEGETPFEYVKQLFDELWDEIQDQTIALGNMYIVQLNERYVRGEESNEKVKSGYIGPEYYDRKFR